MLSFSDADFLNLLYMIISVLAVYILMWYITFMLKKRIIFNPLNIEIRALNEFTEIHHIKNIDLFSKKQVLK